MTAASTLRIRPAVEGDAALLFQAEYQTSLIPGRLISFPDELDPAGFVAKIVWLREHGCYLVAEALGQPVGHASLEPMPLRAMAHVFSLTIVVHPGQTGRGIGRALMAALLHWAEEQPHVEKLELRVREGNTEALRLYQQFGFVEEGRFEKRIKLADGSCLADISMAKILHFP
ncbi:MULTISPECIES: GNAT family N-acetyltransferase [Herbaspirillum]|uniref:GNAT family N-acetyltransferase n=1 Tax=Herbaspirillum TaxID=963 RepID=UPI001E45DD46|nr:MULTISPECIES: GNAT family N-acetyltransferase [Herbaspirillum]